MAGKTTTWRQWPRSAFWMTKWSFWEGDRKDWPKLKKAIIEEYRSDPASAEQAFLSQKREPGESLLVYLAVLERLYRKESGIKEGTELNETSQKVVTRQFLHSIPQLISSSKLQLYYPNETYTNLAKQACDIKEGLACTQSPKEQVASVESTQNDSHLHTLCSELKEPKLLVKQQINSEQSDDVNAISSNQSAPRLSTPRKCFSCGSTSHL